MLRETIEPAPTGREGGTVELARVQRAFSRTAIAVALADVVIGSFAFGGLIYLLIIFPGDRGTRIASRLDLQLAPSDDIAVVAALLAVVLSINIAVAVQPLPTDRSDRVQVIEWQKYVALMAQLMATAAVLMCLVGWTSSRRSHSWGATLGETLLTVATIALAAAVKLRSDDQIVKQLDAYHRSRERLRLDKALAIFDRAHPSAPGRWLTSAAGLMLLAVILTLASTSAFTLIATMLHQPASVEDCVALFLLAAPFECLLLAAGIRLWHIPIAKNWPSVGLEALPVALLGTFWSAIAAAVVVSAPDIRRLAALLGYGASSIALPAAVLFLDRRTDLGGLTLPLRQASRRRLDQQRTFYQEAPGPPASRRPARPKRRLR